MTVKTTTELICNNCGKKSGFTGDRPITQIDGYVGSDFFLPPKCWFKLQPNYEQSLWSTIDFSVSGDFCSPECIIFYVQKKYKKEIILLLPKI